MNAIFVADSNKENFNRDEFIRLFILLLVCVIKFVLPNDDLYLHQVDVKGDECSATDEKESIFIPFAIDKAKSCSIIQPNDIVWTLGLSISLSLTIRLVQLVFRTK